MPRPDSYDVIMSPNPGVSPIQTFIRCVLLLGGVVLLSALARAADSAASWSVTISKPNAVPGEEVELIVTARIAAHWIVYSSDFQAEIGPQPTTFRFDGVGTFEPVGPLVPIAARRGRDKTWETDYTYFAGRAEFRQRVTVRAAKFAGTIRIKGQLCNERDGTCTLFEEVLKL